MSGVFSKLIVPILKKLLGYISDFMSCTNCFFVFLNICYCISSDFSDLPDMTGEYIVLSAVYSTSQF